MLAQLSPLEPPSWLRSHSTESQNEVSYASNAASKQFFLSLSLFSSYQCSLALSATRLQSAKEEEMSSAKIYVSQPTNQRPSPFRTRTPPWLPLRRGQLDCGPAEIALSLPAIVIVSQACPASPSGLKTASFRVDDATGSILPFHSRRRQARQTSCRAQLFDTD